MQFNNTTKFKVDGTGTVTATAYNGNGAALTGITPTFAGLYCCGMLTERAQRAYRRTPWAHQAKPYFRSGCFSNWSTTNFGGANITYAAGRNFINDRCER